MGTSWSSTHNEDQDGPQVAQEILNVAPLRSATAHYSTGRSYAERQSAYDQRFAQSMSTYSMPSPPTFPPLNVKAAAAVRAAGTILRGSVRLNVTKNGALARFTLSFQVDILVRTSITVWVAAIIPAGSDPFTQLQRADEKLKPQRVVLEAGRKQLCTVDLPVSSLKEFFLPRPVPGTQFHSLVVMTEPELPADMQKFSSQLFFFKLTEGTDEVRVSLEKQIGKFNNQVFGLQEIYGLHKGEKSDETMCIICLSAERTTALLPCRHFCLCSECAEILRYQSGKCPICREQATGLFQLNVQEPTAAATAVDTAAPSAAAS